jgi:Flp pilus assembly pilin Flp
LRNTKGAALVEYGILVGLIAVVAIGSISSVGEKIAQTFRGPAAQLDWYVIGASEDELARFRFVSQQSGGNVDVVGFQIGTFGGTSPYGSISEAVFDGLDVRSVQFNDNDDTLEIVLAGNTVAATQGHEMVCIDLTNGEEMFSVDFDTVSGYYFSAFTSTAYSLTMTQTPFVIGQDLACTIAPK